MESFFSRQAAARLAAIAVIASCLVSVLALYAKFYFWGGTRYAPLGTKLAIWFVILAGPISLTVVRKAPSLALGVAAFQFALVALASA